MQRRHLLGLLATSGAVLVGVPRVVEARRPGSPVVQEVLVPISANDQASAPLEEVRRRIYQVNQTVHLMSTEAMPFSGYLQPMAPPIDYKRLAEELSQALKDMPPPRIRIGEV